jgi:hypothetical protein
VRMTELPMSPPRLLGMLLRRRGDSLETQAAAAD